MSDRIEQRYLRLIAGQSRGVGPTLARGALALVEPLYATAMRFRNRRYDRGGFVTLPRPVISVGNITTGGTGKTPVVEFLARQLLAIGQRPAILLRGYKSTAHGSDEAAILTRSLGPTVPVEPNRDRRAGAAKVLQDHPETTLFLLDDGFQHRRIARQLNIVLIDATNPFGFGHVLPRGLLREPLAGLSRADLLLLTRVDLASDLQGLEQTLRTHNRHAPILRSNHRITEFRSRDGQVVTPARSIAFCGLGNPDAFYGGLRQVLRDEFAGTMSFPDHHAFSPDDLTRLRDFARQSSAVHWLTTSKDEVKLSQLPGIDDCPILVAQLRIDFQDGHADQLMQLIQSKLSMTG